MVKKKTNLKFNKNKTTSKNYKEFEKYVFQLNKDFGEILIRHLNTSDNLREDIKEDVLNYINQNISDA